MILKLCNLYAADQHHQVITIDNNLVVFGVGVVLVPET